MAYYKRAGCNLPLTLSSAHFLLDMGQKKCSYSERVAISIQLLKKSSNINMLYPSLRCNSRDGAVSLEIAHSQ